MVSETSSWLPASGTAAELTSWRESGAGMDGANQPEERTAPSWEGRGLSCRRGA